MSRFIGRIPEIKRHKTSGRAFVLLGGKQRYLGRYGSAEARENYERVIAEWLTQTHEPRARTPEGPLIVEVAAAFMMHAIAYYRSADGSPTGEADNVSEAMKPVLTLYRSLPAKDFTTAEMDAVRMRMIASGLARSTINDRVNRIRRVFKWAASKKMIPGSTHVDLTTLAPLLKNRTHNNIAVRESRKIAPVPYDRIRAILPHVPEAVAAMVEIQHLTGCRAGEVIGMRVGELNRGVDPWEYKPKAHKNAYRETECDRMIPLGPRAQAILAPFLKRRTSPDAHVFDPRESVVEAKRKGRVFRIIAVKPYYDRRAYAQAIYRGCDRAFPHPTLSKVKVSRTIKLTKDQRDELKEWRSKNRWSPLQIRHATATRVREKFGLEAAQAMLGHAKMDTTEIYALKQAKLAREIARATG